MGKFAGITALLLMLTVTTLTTATADAAQNGSIIIAVIPEVNLVKQMERFTPLGRYLEKQTGLIVEIKPLSNYGMLYEEIRDGNVDAGFFGSFVYAMTRARTGIEPLVRPVHPDGRSTYTGMIFVRKDSGIRKPGEMKGKTIALVDPATTGGYLAQKEYLLSHGIDLDRDMKIHWAINHEGAIRAVMNRQADIGGAKDTVVRKFRKENRIFDALVNIVGETPKKGVPENTLAVRKGIDPNVREKLKKALLAMHSNPDGSAALAKLGSARFIPTSDADFKPLYDMVRQMNIDLKSYPYRKINGKH